MSKDEKSYEGKTTMESEDSPYGWKMSKPKAAIPEPPPTGHGDMVIFEVTADLIARAKMGIEKYNTPLRVNNGRDALNDAYQELLDATMYLKQVIMERDQKLNSNGYQDMDYVATIEGGVDV